MENNLRARVREYLQGGGLFNPELANHYAVRDLIVDLDAALAASPAPPVTQEPLELLVLNLQAHAKEHDWQDTDEPIAALLAYQVDDFRVIGSGYEAGFDAGYPKGYADGMDESAGDPRVERIEAGFKAMRDATNDEFSKEDMIVLDALQAGRDFAVRLARREQHIQQLIEERADSAPVAPPVTCEWRDEKLLKRDDPHWETGCGKTVRYMEAGNFEFCPYCGKPLSLSSGGTPKKDQA